METLVIAVGEQRSTVAEIIRGKQAPFTLGRALHNDVVLTDPYVGAEQLRFHQREGHWYATVLDDVNPVLVNDEPVEGDEIALASGDRLTIGRTHLEVYSEAHRVEPARKLLLSSWLYHGRRALFIALLATISVAALDALIDYFEYTEQRNLEDFFTSALSTIAIIMVWAGIWALIGRLTKHQAHYSIQLLVTALVSGVISLALPIPSYIDYWFSSYSLAILAGYALAIALLALLLRWNIYYATHPGRPWLNALATSLACVLTYAGVTELQEPDYNPAPRYSASLKPPFAKPPVALWRDGKDLDQFLASSEAVARARQQAAAEEEGQDKSVTVGHAQDAAGSGGDGN